MPIASPHHLKIKLNILVISEYLCMPIALHHLKIKLNIHVIGKVHVHVTRKFSDVIHVMTFGKVKSIIIRIRPPQNNCLFAVTLQPTHHIMPTQQILLTFWSVFFDFEQENYLYIPK